MAGQIELVKGDMFEGPSDMIVIPCSTLPTVTWFVGDRLSQFSMPEPTRAMQAGEVLYRDVGDATHVAQTAAYAASVDAGLQTQPEAIRRIGQSLGRYAAANEWVRLIACPLLGTGAGYLDIAIAAEELTQGFLGTAPPGAVLRLFALGDENFRAVRGQLGSERDRSTEVTVSERPLRVLVSYTRSSPEHGNWVKWLAGVLRQNGVDCRLDEWHLRPGMDVAQWMCNELDLADKVLLVCDATYAQKADRRHGGVGWEIRLVQGDLLMSQSENPDRYVPIVVEESLESALPAFLKSVYCLHWPHATDRDEQKINQVLRTVYGAFEEAPPIGRPPAFVVAATD